MSTFRLNLRADIDVGQLARIPGQLPYAVAEAINQSAKDAQSAIRQRVSRIFTLRTANSRRFMLGLVRIRRNDFAKRDRLEATVRVAGPVDILGRDTRADVLARHEKGGTSVSHNPLEPFYVRGDAYQNMPRRFYPAALGLADRRAVEGHMIPGRMGSVRGRGRRRRSFFVMRGVGIFMREGPDEIQKIWHFTQKVTVRPQLQFVATGRKEVLRTFEPNLRAQIDRLARERQTRQTRRYRG